LLTWSLLQPIDKTSKETHGTNLLTGEFCYSGYSYSDSDRTTPTLFLSIIDEFEIHFEYSDSESQPVVFKVILADKNDRWQKEFPVQLPDESITSFPFDFNNLLSLGATINEELGLTDNGYRVKIVAHVDRDNDPFEAILEGQLNSNTLAWDNSSFLELERGYPGSNEWVYGSYGYTLKLKDNSLYGSTTIEREATIPEIQLIPPGSVLSLDTTESLDIDFNYTFLSNLTVNSIVSDYRLDMAISEQDRWDRTVTLIEDTGISDDFNISIPIDIDKLVETIEEANQEVGGRSIGRQDIVFMVEVHSTADTNVGIIDETFAQELRGTIRDEIQWDTSTADGEGLIASKSSEVASNITLSDQNIKLLRICSLIGLVLALGLSVLLSFMYVHEQRNVITSTSERENIHKKYGHLISEISTFPQVRDGEELVEVLSIEDLVNISNNSLKPILFKTEAGDDKYLVMDNSKWYLYRN